MKYVPLHHGEGEAAGFDGMTVVIIATVLLVLGGVGYGIYRLVRKGRFGY